MIYQLLVVVMLGTGIEYSSSGWLSSPHECQERAATIRRAYRDAYPGAHVIYTQCHQGVRT